MERMKHEPIRPDVVDGAWAGAGMDMGAANGGRE